jgi:tetratricopeptide (TPR) repeat protein
MKRKVTSAVRNPLIKKPLQPLSRDFEVTVRPVYHPSLSILSEKNQQEFHSTIPLIREEPEKALIVFRDLYERYPGVPPVKSNLIASLYAAGHDDEAEAMALELYSEHPDYIFAKIIYAEYCLLHDRLDEIPAIFNNVWDPKLLYPDREVFHVSEVTALIGFMGLYFYAIGQMDLARQYYDYLYNLAPTHPQTLRLKNVIFPDPEPLIP